MSFKSMFRALSFILSPLLFVLSPLLLVLSLSHIGYAAEDILREEVDEIVVTATRTERKTEDIPAGVSVVTEERLKDLQLFGPKEALTGLPGVIAESRNNGYDARLIIRGAGLKARYGVREIMVLLDGVPITDPDGMTRLDFVDTQLMSRVEVVRGPNSTLYGANAAGGVINIITVDPFEERKIVKLGYGEDNTKLVSALVSSNSGPFFATLSGSYKKTDGWRDWNEFESTQGGIRTGYLFEDGSVLEGTYNYTKADLQLPGSLTKEEFKEDPTQQTSDPFRNNGRYSTIHSGHVKWTKEQGDWQFKPMIYLQSWDHDHPVPGGINDGGADVYGADLQANLNHELFGAPAQLTVGLSGQYDDGDTKKYTYGDVATEFVPFPPPGSERILYTLSDRKGDLSESNDEQVGKWGIYLQESLTPTDRWIIDVGVRYDQVNFDIDSTIYQEFIWGANIYRTFDPPERITVDESFDEVSPRIAAIYRLTDTLNLYGNISTGFQTPQASELEENRHLDPSTTYNYEVGTKYRHPAGHSLDLAFFYQEVKDEIVQSLLDNNQVSYSNAGQTNKYGLEAAGQLQLPYYLTLNASYTYSDFEYDDFKEPIRVFNPAIGRTEVVLFNRSGNQLPYIPRHMYNLGLAYRHPAGFRMSVDTSSWGSYYVDNANSEKYSGYDFLTHLLVGWERGPWDLSIDVNNLFDKDYAMEVTKSGDELQYRPGAPRNVFAKVSYSF